MCWINCVHWATQHKLSINSYLLTSSVEDQREMNSKKGIKKLRGKKSVNYFKSPLRVASMHFLPFWFLLKKRDRRGESEGDRKYLNSIKKGTGQWIANRGCDVWGRGGFLWDNLLSDIHVGRCLSLNRWWELIREIPHDVIVKVTHRHLATSTNVDRPIHQLLYPFCWNSLLYINNRMGHEMIVSPPLLSSAQMWYPSFAPQW